MWGRLSIRSGFLALAIGLLIVGGGTLVAAITGISAPIAMVLIGWVFGTVSGVRALRRDSHSTGHH
jgi:hypothetical protein